MSKWQFWSSKRTKWLLWVVVILIITAIGIKFYLGYQKLNQMDQKIARLKEDIKQLKQKKKGLQAEIKRANTPQFIKHTAREKLGLIKEGEMLYITVEKDKQEGK